MIQRHFLYRIDRNAEANFVRCCMNFGSLDDWHFTFKLYFNGQWQICVVLALERHSMYVNINTFSKKSLRKSSTRGVFIWLLSLRLLSPCPAKRATGQRSCLFLSKKTIHILVCTIRRRSAVHRAANSKRSGGQNSVNRYVA